MKSKEAKIFIDEMFYPKSAQQTNNYVPIGRKRDYEYAVELSEKEFIDKAAKVFRECCQHHTDGMCDFDDREPMYNDGCVPYCYKVKNFVEKLSI